MDNEFGYNFVGSVAKTYGTEMTNGFKTMAFWYQDQKGLVKEIRDRASLESLKHHLFNRLTNNGPGLLIKACVEAIRSRGFERLDGP